jgi:hypothetical protein
VAFWRAPDHAFRPQHQVAQLLDHGVVIGHHRQRQAVGLNIRVSAKCSSRRAASSVSRRLKERSRVDPYSSRMRGLWVDFARLPACLLSAVRPDRCRCGDVVFGHDLLLRQGARWLIEPAAEPQGHAHQGDQYRHFHQG